MSSALRSRLTLEAMDPVFVCDVGTLVEPHIGAVDALARLQLAARRSGCRIALQGVPPAMSDLLELMGLTDVLPCGEATSSRSALEARRQPEQREEPLRVEEEADPGDPAVADLEDL